MAAGLRAVEYGKSYVCSCHGNLNHIAFPLVCGKEYLGCVLLGPFLMSDMDHTLLAQLTDRYKLSLSDSLELFDEARQIPVISPSQANNICEMLYFLFGNLLEGSMHLLHLNNQRLTQQSQINESIQRYKGLPVSMRSYPHQQEKELADSIQSRDPKQTATILNELMGFVLASEEYDMNILRARAFELCTLLSRAVITAGASSVSIFRVNDAFFQELNALNSPEELCARLQEIAESFCENVLDQNFPQCSDAVKNAISYIDQHFNEPITLSQVAEVVHLNPTYFSATFKQSIGYTFKEYLNLVRIEESKRLLANTNISIVEIAGACGFEGQSYFSKVFRRLTGMTPKQYRKI